MKRVVSLLRCLSIDGKAVNYKVNEFGTYVVSGMDQESWEYFVRIGVGSPPYDY